MCCGVAESESALVVEATCTGQAGGACVKIVTKQKKKHMENCGMLHQTTERIIEKLRQMYD